MYGRRYGDEWMLDAALSYVGYARKSGYNPVSLAVAWVAAHPGVTAPIIGARNVTQLDDSLRSMDVEITDELYSELCSFTPTPAPATDRTEDLSQK